MTPIKILHVLDHSIPLHSGYTFRTRSILKHQHQLGFETVHVTGAKHQPYEVSEEIIDDLKFYRTAPGKLSQLPVLNQWDVVSGLTRRLDEVIKQEKPDIIHAHSPALNGLAAVKAANKHKLPLVYEVRAFWEDAAVDHGTTKENSLRYKLTRHMETHVLENADAITCICEGLRNDIIKRGFPEEKITVIPNAVNVEQFEFNAPKDESLVKDLQLGDETLLGFIGSFYGYEGIDLLVRALPQVSKPVKLLLVGGGQQESAIHQLVNELSLQDKVIFTGRVPHHEVGRYYDLVDLFVYPRKSMRLTDLVTPLKPLEAMAKGKIVIASDVGGHRELIEPGKTGFLFTADNVTALAKTIDDVIDQKDSWAELRQNGRDYVEHDRNWKNSVARYQPLYQSLLNR